ncbi:MAG: hypothetical protein ABFD07_01840 [Methanobacterium sp.]
MKHLKAFGKLFESNQDLWEQISGSEWASRESKWGKDVPIDDKDKQAIRELVNSNWGTKKPEYVNWDFNLSFSGGRSEIEICSDEGYGESKILLYVIKTPDEWYLVKEYFYKWHKGGKTSSWRQTNYRDLEGNSVYESYYKCDSIDGLLELIKARRAWLYTKS